MQNNTFGFHIQIVNDDVLLYIVDVFAFGVGFISPGKCPAAPAAALPGNVSRIFSQEIFLIFCRKYLSLC